MTEARPESRTPSISPRGYAVHHHVEARVSYIIKLYYNLAKRRMEVWQMRDKGRVAGAA
jgi:hypothetical protein